MALFLTRSFRALLWRNFLYRKRRWIPSLFEFFLPALCVSAIYFIKLDLTSGSSSAASIVSSSLASVTVPSYLPNASDAVIPLSFQDYVTSILAKRTCIADPNATVAERILGLANLVISGINYDDWSSPFVFCNSYNCRKNKEDAFKYCTYRILALASSEPGGRAYGNMLRLKEYTERRYPQILNRSLLPFDYDLIQLFESHQQLEDYVTSTDYGEFTEVGYKPKVAIAVVFEEGDGSDKTYEYTIRVNSTNFNSQEQMLVPAVQSTPPTTHFFDHYLREDSYSCGKPNTPTMGKLRNSCTGKYMLNGALGIQRLVDDWILQDASSNSFGSDGLSEANVTVAQNGVVFLPFPTKEYTKNGFYEQVAPFTPLLFTLGLLYPVASTIRSIVLEKEYRQKELMKMMSVTECDIGWSWFISLFVFFSPSAALTAMFTKLLYSNSNFVILLIFWEVTFISCIVMCFLIGSFSKRATRSTLVGILLFFVGYFLPFIVDIEIGSSGMTTLVSLHPVTAYTYGLMMISYLEDSGVGVIVTSASTSQFPSGYTFAKSVSMLLFDSIVWGILSWYLNRVLTGDYGTSLPWYFPFLRQYWCPSYALPTSSDDYSSINYDSCVVEPVSDQFDKQHMNDGNVEIFNLRKEFGDKTAVDGLNLKIYRNQITALLGHNGAGKTTTIGMLTGMIPPTSGFATVAGYDIRTDLSLLRENVGVCLQHDCLFPQLTVKEHIEFFAQVKGLYAKMSRSEAINSVLATIEDVALMEKRNTFSKDLSGGMKRKLSVAIAFCGDSKVVFLDEPTSGMDPFSRRFTWNVIRQYRDNRCIILTTHFMDEADLLGDRIAIMAAGRLRCVGSPLFLKKHYGVGYQLTIVKRLGTPNLATVSTNETESSDESPEKVETELGPAYVSGQEVSLVMSPPPTTKIEKSRPLADDELKKIVQSAVPEANVLNDIGTEVSFQLPIGTSSCFTGMLERLDVLKENCAIETYGVSITTLDEVFLMVARDDGTLTSLKDSKADTAYEAEFSNRYRLSTNSNERGSFSRHVKVLFAKRALNFKRDKKAWFCSTILPAAISLAGFLIVKFVPIYEPNQPPLTLSLDVNNPEVKSLRNPIPYNAPGVFECQPGNCIQSNHVNDISETSEVYYYCGGNALVDHDGGNGSAVCTISDSDNIIDRITEHDSFGVENNVSDVLSSSAAVLASVGSFRASQFGAIFFTRDESSIITGNGSKFDVMTSQSCLSNTGDYLSGEQCNYYQGVGYIVNYNFTSFHSSVLYQAIADEALLRGSLNDSDYKISANVWPLPRTQAEDRIVLSQDSFAAWFLLVLSFPFIAGTFATFVVAERESKAKHLQTVSGVKPGAYWLSTYFWDIMNYQIPLWTIIILMYLLNVEVFLTTRRKAVYGTFALLVLFGPAAAGFTYIVSFFFKSPSMCNLFVIVFNFFLGMAGPITVGMLRLLAADPASNYEHLKAAAIPVEWVLRLVPSFSLGRGLFFILNMEVFEFIEAEPLTVWDSTIALSEVIFLAAESIVYILVTIQIDILLTKPKAVYRLRKFSDFITLKWILNRNKTRHIGADSAENENEDDDDVIAEGERVVCDEARDDLIVLNELTKKYPNGKLAVDHLSLGIPAGECFGLLGINGAGKTTTMAMLTAEFPPTSGDALLAGFSVNNEPEQTRKRIGYCPQFDAHFMNMTGREHVQLYAVIKGVPADVIDEAVSAKLNEVGLSEYDGNRLSVRYSGGMKRKLSVACATIGQPQIVFLDEPSTGMDPVARRDLWKVISRMVQGPKNIPQRDKTSVILTTHSMEECEALCPRIGIMAGGKLRCLGSAQHLKSRFGQGYQIEMKIIHATDSDKDVQSMINTLLNHLGFHLSQEESELYDLVKLGSETYVTLGQAKEACDKLVGDGYLSMMISADNPIGYHIYKSACSYTGVDVSELASFCVEELRLRDVTNFVMKSYPDAVLRERQDVKMRFEISSKGVTISSVFANIEEHKNNLKVNDYGVSQTSLEQVFNMHAAQAEEAKKNKVDDGRS